jgi:hypothetical protein
VIAQPGSRKIVLSFDRPETGMCSAYKFMVYKNTENELYAELRSQERQCDVSGNPGSVVAVYVSVRNPNTGLESRKVGTTARVLAEEGAPVDPPPALPPSGGGGGGTCFSGATLVRGLVHDVPIQDLRPGDSVLTAAGIWAQVDALQVHPVESAPVLSIDGGMQVVTPEHKLLIGGEWIRAAETGLFVGREAWYTGDLFNLSIRTDELLSEMTSPLTQRSYTLAAKMNGITLVAHNSRAMKAPL